MKKIIYGLILIAIVMILEITAFKVIDFLMDISRAYADEQSRQKCMEYEMAGVIKRGSCACTEKLFDNFSHSYDWIDACAILEAKSK